MHSKPPLQKQTGRLFQALFLSVMFRLNLRQDTPHHPAGEGHVFSLPQPPRINNRSLFITYRVVRVSGGWLAATWERIESREPEKPCSFVQSSLLTCTS
ncbi:hypothetical protein CesoFtcFv8_007154 [Champsocephalus esox]|uniref:Uncharacterized protein n=2 Tax=Champsocephalus esox TaxID=159716 RepID=A0AAN8CE01_9TELE|nr:hypothetical protein CesoFtcFv8_007154 [Champsocephalus esox]